MTHVYHVLLILGAHASVDVLRVCWVEGWVGAWSKLAWSYGGNDSLC